MFKISSQLELDQNLSLKISDTDSETEKFLIISSDNLVVEICWFDHFQFAWYSKASLHPRQTNSARLLFWKKLKKMIFCKTTKTTAQKKYFFIGNRFWFLWRNSFFSVESPNFGSDKNDTIKRYFSFRVQWKRTYYLTFQQIQMIRYHKSVF